MGETSFATYQGWPQHWDLFSVALVLLHFFLLRCLAFRPRPKDEEPWCQEVLGAVKRLDLPELLRSFKSPTLCRKQASKLLLRLDSTRMHLSNALEMPRKAFKIAAWRKTGASFHFFSL